MPKCTHDQWPNVEPQSHLPDGFEHRHGWCPIKESEKYQPETCFKCKFYSEGKRDD